MTGQYLANVDKVREAADAGFDDLQIAGILNLGRAYVCVIARMNDIALVKSVSPKAVKKLDRVEQIRALAAEGLTYEQAAPRLGLLPLSFGVLARKYGIEFKHGAKRAEPSLRTRQMAAMYQNGSTLQQIGDQYALTRERVRQLITKHHDLRRPDGGMHKRSVEKRAKFEAKRNSLSLTRWGCNWDQYVALRTQKKPTRAFASQKQNAAKRSIGWELNLWQWWSIWQQSGKWVQRGRGNGYMMCRTNDVGPYAIGNVYIATGCENSSREHAKTSGLPRGVSRKRKSGSFTATRCIGGKKTYLGSHPTPELAHAAYLSSVPQRKAAA